MAVICYTCCYTHNIVYRQRGNTLYIKIIVITEIFAVYYKNHYLSKFNYFRKDYFYTESLIKVNMVKIVIHTFKFLSLFLVLCSTFPCSPGS